MNLNRAVWLCAMLAVTGNALAQTSSCPKPADIKQYRMDKGGYHYLADGPVDQKWVGENETAAELRMASLEFTAADYKPMNDERNSMPAVICDYVGAGYDAVRLVLKPVHQFSPAPGTSWNNNYCKANDNVRCAFNHQ
ncbi:DUF3757 domain-containing protein [Pseudomonas fluorescens]|uniref:DUF3757 domain-containing protein n=1 Tax=Pseudomonas fluorescens TaxID=294 RepID=A0A7Z6QSI1_PSEFL|nr:DUF3757 domain-containing protein [Pseudomonas fluorescens]RDS93128.1 DUF3757 domain-containing protein [Pseudomonas fluorescens]